MGASNSTSDRERKLQQWPSYSSDSPRESYFGNSPSYNYFSGEHISPPYTSPPSYHYDPQFSRSYSSEDKPSRNKYARIGDNYRSLDEVTAALAQAGLESSNLIVGIDFTKSNEWTGAKSFHRKSLHHIGSGPNPYEQAISIIGRTLSAFDDDNLIPCYGFGDASTHDQDVFSFYPDERCCEGFEEVLSRYRELVPRLRLAGPTSFAPIIEMGITIVEQSGGQYHVLLIIADGLVTRSVETSKGDFSSQERKTIDAIVRASNYPLSIVLVGVGDGPWDTMKEFDDNIPSRAFDNFQFVNFAEIMAKNLDESRKEAEFALAALMEIPSQYKATMELGFLGRRLGDEFGRIPLPTPIKVGGSEGKRPSPSTDIRDEQLCPICLTNAKDMAFGCGHQTCCECGEDLQSCPLCRVKITTRIKLY